MNQITMSAAETAIYDHGEDEAKTQLMRRLLSRARTVRRGDETVEIYTADGIVAALVQD
jgi:hypothetical protein